MIIIYNSTGLHFTFLRLHLEGELLDMDRLTSMSACG